MSLTGKIKNDPVWKMFFKENVPKKNEFKTLSGHIAFSNEYVERVQYTLSNSGYAGVVGTAFDYCARWIIARTAHSNWEQAFEDLTAEYGVEICQYMAQKENVNIQQAFEESIDKCKMYVNGCATLDNVFKDVVLLAKLEQVARRGTFPFDVNFGYIFNCEDEIVSDLSQLCNLFEEIFIKGGIITKDSQVVYNPTFGGASVLCGGADADIYIDGTLYDFKCSRKKGYSWTDAAQLLGYYLLSCVAKKKQDEDNHLKDCEIKRIAFYRARYGEIEYLDVAKDISKDLIILFENVLDMAKYQKYLEEEKQAKEQEQREREQLEKELEEQREKEKRELEEILRRGNKTEIIFYRMKKLLKSEDYFNRCIKKHRSDKQKMKEMKSLIKVFYNSRIDVKIDGKKMQQIMKRECVSIDDLSKKLNRTPTTVKNWMAGKSTPSVGVYIEMLQFLHCESEDLARN